MFRRRYYPPRNPPSLAWRLLGIIILIASMVLGGLVKIWWVHYTESHNQPPPAPNWQDEAKQLNKAVSM